MKIYLLSIPFLLILLSSCNQDDLSQSDLDVSVSDNSIILENNSNESIYHFIVDRNALALISWAPTLDEEIEVKSGDSVEILFADITGYTDETEELSVSFWGATKENGKRVPDEIFQMIISIN